MSHTGKLLKRAEELRVLADYTLTELTRDDVEELMKSADWLKKTRRGLCDGD